MANVTIKMTTDDLDFIKITLLQAEANTQTSPPRKGVEPDKERVKLANTQINQILDYFGWK